MSYVQPSLFRRSDTFFGVCEALGEDFGFNPLVLRITFGVLLLWNPTVIIGTYLAAGVLVMISRFAFPKARRAVQPALPGIGSRSGAEETLALAA